MATIRELYDALGEALDFDEAQGDREICIGILTGSKITRAEISDTYEMVWTPDTSLGADDDAGEDRFWIVVQDDRENFYNIPDDVREMYR